MYITKPIRLNPECVSCLVTKQIGRYPKNASKNEKIQYMQSILKVIADAPAAMSAPEIVDKIYKIQRHMFNAQKDYSKIKYHFNKLMLDMESDIQNDINISISNEPLKLAMQYAMMGNYIDFGAMNSVDESKLKELLATAKNNYISDTEFNQLKNDLKTAEHLVYLTDNCGEIVLDKIMIKTIKLLYPKLNITVIVRGEPVVNDAVIDDAEQVGLTNMVKVIDNGSSIAGTCLNKISKEAEYEIENADLIISKGQGNFETLQQCDLNIYYIFMCKCNMFADRFNVPLYSGILINDKNIKRA